MGGGIHFGPRGGNSLARQIRGADSVILWATSPVRSVYCFGFHIKFAEVIQAAVFVEHIYRNRALGGKHAAHGEKCLL